MGRIGRAIGRGVPDLGVEDGDSETPSPGFEEFSRETCYSLLCRVDQEGGCMVPEGSGSGGVLDLPDLSRSDLQLLAVGVGVKWKASKGLLSCASLSLCPFFLAYFSVVFLF